MTRSTHVSAEKECLGLRFACSAHLTCRVQLLNTKHLVVAWQRRNELVDTGNGNCALGQDLCILRVNILAVAQLA